MPREYSDDFMQLGGIKKTRSDYYADAKKQGDRAFRRAEARGQYPYLPALEEFVRGESTDAGIPLGIMEIPLERVIGTKTRGRQEAFACNFMPILTSDSEFAAKWEALYASHQEEGIRDAVKVYEYLWNFYVLEGNKRVSVLKYDEMPEILADVTRIMPKGVEEELAEAYAEFHRFFSVCPLYDLVFEHPGGYRRIAELLDQNLDEKWPEEKVRGLSLCFMRFRTAFHSLFGERLQIAVQHAFLIYLSYYRHDDPLEAAGDLMEKRVEKLREEFDLRTSRNPISLSEEPTIKENTSIFSSFRQPLYSEKHPLVAAFLYDTSPEESGWLYGHELGRLHVEETFRGAVRTLAFRGCKGDEATRSAIDQAVNAGAELIFTTSPTMSEETMRAAVHFTKIRFLNCAVRLSHGSMRTYYGRMHEAKFLMGVLAATLTENHRIGYVADYPIFGSVSRINAFAIGASMADPKAEVYLTWTSLSDVNWREEMKKHNIHVVSGPDLLKPTEVSKDFGLYALAEDGGLQHLAMPVWNWGAYYELMIHNILNGTYDKEEPAEAGQSISYWWGMSAGVIDIILSEKLPYTSHKMIGLYREALINETFHPFVGELHKQGGELVAKRKQRLTAREIMDMSWLNDNVKGSIPEYEELSEAGKEAVRSSGIFMFRDRGK